MIKRRPLGLQNGRNPPSARLPPPRRRPRQRAGLDRGPVSQQVSGEREFVLSQPNGRGQPGRMPGSPAEIRLRQPGEGEPGWAGGLRKLYNSVVEEPLPDSFKDLLKKLDDSDDA